MIWTNEENETLERLWKRPDLTSHDIAKVFPNRSPSAITKHASVMGFKKEISSKIDFEKLGEIELFKI